LEKGDITRQQAEDFQRKKLQGFTTRELTQLDAITASSRNLPPATLANDIIPLLQKYRWEKTPPKAFTRTDLYPLSNGNGLWVMDNPEVARIMEPILRLASRILLSSYMLPWVPSLPLFLVCLTGSQLDAFLNGERRSIPEHRIPEKYKRTSTPEETASKAISFHLRPNVDPQATAIRRDQVFEGLMTRWNYTFGFSSPNEDPRGPHFNQDLTRQYAETLLNNEQMKYEKDTNPTWGVWTYIGYSDVELLLRDDLNDADRLCLEWVTANVVRFFSNLGMCLRLDTDSP
jgi:hypothetical protein